MNLNKDQKIAYDHLEWPLLIIAWAGSGKTATVTARIQNMVQNKNITWSEILAVTFTNKAALEMKERIWKALWVTYSKNPFQNRWFPFIWTFHSLGIFILKEVFEKFDNINIWVSKNFIIYDESDKMSVIKSIMRDDLKLDEKKYPARSIASYISNAKNALISAKQYANYVDSHIKEIVRDAYLIYDKKMTENNALDFDDILVKTLEALKHDNVIEYYWEKYKFIMVDEYQDTNAPQYEIVKLLASKYRNLVVVWDDWQSIYSWRWANMQNILNFQKDYPEAKIVKLEQNYRSTKHIINAANWVIKNNKTAIEKTLFTDNETWEKITYINAPTDRIEASSIAKIIKNKYLDWWTYWENLILYRTNGQSRGLEEALLMEAIPYKVVWGLKFYDRKEIKDLLAYLKIILNPNDVVGLKRIINTPPRKIWPTTLEKLDQYSNDFWISYADIMENIEEVDELNNWAKTSISSFYQIIEDLKSQAKIYSVFDMIDYIIEKIQYKAYLEKESDTKEEFEAKLDNISELKNVASNYNWIEPSEALTLFLEEISLMTDLENKDNNALDFVTLMTIHTSKWLEYSRVFITWLEDGLFPSSRSMTDLKDLEEERRLMYVALTRAKKELFISKAKERFTYGQYVTNPESRFVKEINPAYVQEYDLRESMWWSIFWSSFNSLSTPGEAFSFNTTSNTEFKVMKNKVENDVWEFNVWDKVSHSKFGIWSIISKSWDIAEIYFSWIWTKKMNIKIAPVVKV